MERARNVSEHCLFELKLTPVLLVSGTESNFPKHKIVAGRLRSTAQQSHLLFRRHSEDSKSL